MNNNKWKRYAALAGVVLLIVVCCLPMVFAFGSGEKSQAMFRASFGVAILLPVVLYAMLLVYRLLNKKKKVENAEVENIIFDVGQVLVKYDWKTYLDGFGFSSEINDRIAKAVFLNDIWNERDRGLYDEQYYIEEMVKNDPGCEKEIRQVMARVDETIIPVDYAQTWVKYLKDKGYHIYILSNYSVDALEHTRSKLSFLKYTDGAIFSGEVKMIKPEPEIYHTLLDRYHLDPDRSVFIDDRKDNCQAAEKLGIHTILFTSFQQAAKELEKFGVK